MRSTLDRNVFEDSQATILHQRSEHIMHRSLIQGPLRKTYVLPFMLLRTSVSSLKRVLKH
jgi:hypothetical protein